MQHYMNDWTLDYDESYDPAGGLAVVGMRPDRSHQITVTVRDANGAAVEAGPFGFTTPALYCPPGRQGRLQKP